MIFVGLVAIIGGIATATLMSPHGFLLAVLAAPLGGSLSALLGALYLAYRRSAGRKAVSIPEDQANKTPAALRASARQGRDWDETTARSASSRELG